MMNEIEQGEITKNQSPDPKKQGLNYERAT